MKGDSPVSAEQFLKAVFAVLIFLLLSNSPAGIDVSPVQPEKTDVIVASSAFFAKSPAGSDFSPVQSMKADDTEVMAAHSAKSPSGSDSSPVQPLKVFEKVLILVCPANRSSGSDVNPVQSVKVLANPVAATVANNPEGSDCNDVHPSNVLVKVKFPVAEKVANRSSGSVRSEEQPSKRLLPFLMLVVWPNSPLGIEAIDAHSEKIDATLETSGQEASRSEGMDVSFVHPLKACEKSVHLVIVEKSPRGIEPIGQSWKTAEQLVTPTCRAKRPAGIVSIPAPLNAP